METDGYSYRKLGTFGRDDFDSDPIAADNLSMPSTKQPTKKSPMRKARPSKAALSNAALLKLASKNKPPQRWYDEQADPTQPAASNGRGK
jgi:hypothetical protein